MPHPWRYFVADGASLAKLEQILADYQGVDAALQALAEEVGAVSVVPGPYFEFKDPKVQSFKTPLRLVYGPDPTFICNATAPEDFFPDVTDGDGAVVKSELIAIRALPADEQDTARAALAAKYKAESFDGTFFHFPECDEDLEKHSTSRTKKLRLKSNPAFICEDDGEGNEANAFSLDLETDEGFLLSQRLNEIFARRYTEQRLTQWIHSFALDLSLNGRSANADRTVAEAERIGNEWIIKVPVIIEGIYGADGRGGSWTGNKEGWVLPPDAKPISVSEYYAKLELSGSLRSLAPPAAPANA